MGVEHLLIGLLALAGAMDAGGDRLEVPISQARFSNGPPRYSIPISVNGAAPIDAMLDTGSTGLNVLPAAAVSAKADKSVRPARTFYRNGVVLSGVTAPMSVSFGGRLKVTATISLTQAVTCSPDRPTCPAASIAPSDYRIGAINPGEGFKAILGVGLRAGAADNPLTKLGSQAWIVVLPQPGDPSPGKLILNPSPEERSRFTLFQLPRDDRAAGGLFWADNAVPTCISDGGAAPICGPGLLDSGGPTVVYISRTAPRTTWERGAELELIFGPPGSNALKQGFTVGKGPGTRVESQSPPANLPWEGVNVGVLPFYAWAVLYDAKAGVVGLARRESFTAQ
jgi:hypothetical protein